ECRNGAPLAQLGLSAAPDQLLGLREEFDLANPAAAKLDVVAGDGNGRAATLRMDLPLDRMDVLDRREVEVLAPQERRQRRQEIPAGIEIAGHWACPNEGGTLPILSGTFVVGEGGGQRQGRWCRAWIGPQAQIDPKDIAFVRVLSHQANETLRHACEQ